MVGILFVDDRAHHPTIFTIIDLPAAAAQEAAKLIRAFLQAKVAAFWTGRAGRQPAVVALDAVINIIFVNRNTKLRAKLTGFCPGIDFHEQQLDIVAVVKMAQ